MSKNNHHLSQCTDLLGHLIAFATESQESNLKMIDYLQNFMRPLVDDLWLSYDADKTKANLFASIYPNVAPLTNNTANNTTNNTANSKNQGGVLLSGHTDVVPVAGQQWSKNPYTMWQQEDKLFGRGTCDMKGFIACCMVMAEQWSKRKNNGTLLKEAIHFSFSYDEETGCLGAKTLIAECHKRNIIPAKAIIGEPTAMKVIEGHKSCCEYTTEFYGLAGHSSMPEKGVSAVEYACRYANQLLQLRKDLQQRCPPDSQFDPPYSTVQIGRLIGGISHNVIADKCLLDWELRGVVPEDEQYVHSELKAYCHTILLPAMRTVYDNADILTRTIGEVRGLQPMQQNACRDWVCQLLGETTAGLVPFGTEAGLFQEMGTESVICGPGSILQAHKADEFIAIVELEHCLNFLSNIGDSLFG